MAESFDPYHSWLGIPKADQPAHHYRLLALNLFEADPEVISHAADQRMAHLRTFQAGKHGPLSQKLLNEVAAARVTLLNPQKKAAYDDALRQRLAAADDTPQEESTGNVRLQAELAEIAAASHHLPARQQRPKTPIWAWAVMAAMIAPVAFGILWFATRRPPEVAQRLPEKAEVVKTMPVPATSQAKPAVLVAKKPEVSPPSAVPAYKTPETPASNSDPNAPSPAPAAIPAKAPAPAAPTANTLPATIPAAQPPMANPPATTLPASAASPLQETPKPQELPAPTKQKLPVPDAAAVEQARKAADALFKTEIDRAKTSADKVALAKRVLAQAVDQAGAADKYVLMVMARELAAAARDADTAFQAVDQASEAFEVDRFSLKTEILSAWAKEARTPDARKWVVEQMLLVGEEAIDAGELEAAKELNKLASSRASGIREIAQKMKVYRQRLAEAGKDAEQLKEAQEALAKDPKDPKANLVLGRYLCFSKGNWKKGLPLLALGSDQTLKKLAEQELRSPPTEPVDQVALADGWWEIASTLARGPAGAVKLHAGQWYKQGAAALPEGLVKNKVDQRLREAAKLRTALPQPPLAIAPFDEKQAKQHQQRWAEYLGEPVEIINSIGIKMVLVPPGEFDMGSTAEEMAKAIEEATRDNDKVVLGRIPGESPRHRVRISRLFHLGKCEVTQAEYQRVMDTNSSRFKQVSGQDTGRHPVEMVSWDDAAEFCKRLSALPGERAARVMYRLPTEAEWEYACRAGTATRWYCGNDETSLPDVAWFRKNGGGTTHPVGEKKPNAWDFYDLSGNVWEWCWDWYSKDFYGQSASANPTGPAKGSDRAIRGGSWSHGAGFGRSASRSSDNPAIRHHYLGFRVARVAVD